MGDISAYLRPATLPEALNALASAERRVAAGCTDLLAATAAKTLPGPALDITAIPELRAIERSEEGLRLGAAVTWTQVARANLPPALRGLQQAARQVGALQVQNRGTLGGNLCNASPAADGVPPLLTLDAQVELRCAAGLRRLPLPAFLTGPRRTACRADELLTAILIPAAALGGEGAFLKLGARAHLVISIAMTAARLRLKDGVVAEAALAVGACGPVAVRLPQVEAALIGRAPDPARIDDASVAAALSPIDDLRADAAFRARGAAELLRRTLAALTTETAAA
ncbi:MAG: FAD binding domain-containing protein [Pseudomonadota bacterium]